MECFANGAELKGHKKHHDYFVKEWYEIYTCIDIIVEWQFCTVHIDFFIFLLFFYFNNSINWPLFDIEWSAQEELLLVDGLRIYGIGNWEQIADHIGTKTKYQVGEHYLKVFVESDTWPLPVCYIYNLEYIFFTLLYHACFINQLCIYMLYMYM